MLTCSERYLRPDHKLRRLDVLRPIERHCNIGVQYIGKRSTIKRQAETKACIGKPPRV